MARNRRYDWDRSRDWQDRDWREQEYGRGGRGDPYRAYRSGRFDYEGEYGGYGRGREQERGFGGEYGRGEEFRDRSYGGGPESSRYRGQYGAGYGGYGRERERGGFPRYGGWGGDWRDREYGAYGRQDWSRGEGGYGSSERGEEGGREERGFLERASDEVASWFGDEEAERRREMDRFRGRGPRGYTRSDDRIREDVCDRLTDDPRVDASEVEVSVSKGEVTLTGTVDNREQRRRAEDCAEMVSGVSHVQNNLRVKSYAGSMGTQSMQTGTTGASATTGTSGTGTSTGTSGSGQKTGTS